MLVLVGVPAAVAIVASWRSVLPRKAWEDPSIVHVNRLATHSRLSNYSSFDAAAARGQSPNVVSLRYVKKSVAHQVILEPGIGQFREFESPECILVQMYKFAGVGAFSCEQINLRKARERELATFDEKSTSSGIAEPYAR